MVKLIPVSFGGHRDKKGEMDFGLCNLKNLAEAKLRFPARSINKNRVGVIPFHHLVSLMNQLDRDIDIF